MKNDIDSIDIHVKKNKTLSRWNDYFNNNNNNNNNKSSTQSNRNLLFNPSFDKIFIREFLPQTVNDPILSILRELFVHSFDEFYKEIEIQLKLKLNTTIIEWLNETFDDMKDDMLNKKQRCFILCSNDEIMNDIHKQTIIGFLTLTEEENGSIYIAQFAIDAKSKRRGYGTYLLQHLRTIYPLGTLYWGLCRRANRPAVNFYLKHGAKFIKDEEIATKYAYDPALYTGFQFIDGISIHSESNASDISTFLLNSSKTGSISESTLTRRPHVTYQDNFTMTDPMPELKKLRLHSRNNCCVIS